MVLERGDRASQGCHQHEGTRQAGQSQLWRPMKPDFSSISLASPEVNSMQVWTENPTQLNFGGADVSLFAQLNQRLNSNLVLTKQKKSSKIPQPCRKGDWRDGKWLLNFPTWVEFQTSALLAKKTNPKPQMKHLLRSRGVKHCRTSHFSFSNLCCSWVGNTKVSPSAQDHL